jgi:hypothetical protein
MRAAKKPKAMKELDQIRQYLEAGQDELAAATIQGYGYRQYLAAIGHVKSAGSVTTLIDQGVTVIVMSDTTWKQIERGDNSAHKLNRK